MGIFARVTSNIQSTLINSLHGSRDHANSRLPTIINISLEFFFPTMHSSRSSIHIWRHHTIEYWILSTVGILHINSDLLTWNSCEKCDYIKLFMQESERIFFGFSGFWIFKIPLEFFGFLEVLFTKLKEVPKTSTYASNKTVFVTIIFSFFFKDVNHIRQMILFQRKLSRLRSWARLKMVIRWDILRELVCIICVFFPERAVSKGATLASSSIYSIYDTCETH